MTSEKPKGWEEIGESLARPVVERLRNREWAIEIAKIVGYSVRDVKAWIKHYKQIHAEELQRSKEETTRKRAEIQELREKSDELILSQDLKA